MKRFEFHPVLARWFEEKFGSPTEPQQLGWPAIQSRAHTLIAAPTGSGKTLAAFFAALDELFREGLEGPLPDETRVLYVSPLKALSNDIHKNLEEPLAGLRTALLTSQGHHVEVRAAVRTGDTPAAARQALTRKPPHILVTTPESLYLLLTSGSGRKLLENVRTLIVDEIHALVGNRRGSHLALSMERLAALAKHPLQRIGLSATQKPIEEVARFLVGTSHLDAQGNARCTIVDSGYKRKLDLAIELPGAPLEAVMSNEVWGEVYERLVELIEAHRTTLVFVNTRRLAERVTHQLGERLGRDKVTSHHGSLSAKLRLEAEARLKRGELKALVATASLELGIDIGSVDLVCQVGPTRSIARLLQRVGRAQHQRGGVPKGRVFPLSRDELVECVATFRAVRDGELDHLEIPPKPLDVLAQQVVASAASEDWGEDDLYELLHRAYPYRNLTRAEFDQVVRMLAEGFSTKRGRRAALIHHDAINHRIRARRGARLVALTSGGAIPDTGDYRVVLEPSETFIGTVNEDFAVESLAGDIFQLGNASWRILRIISGMVRVEDAHGQPPNMPFWLGEAPGRTAEVSRAVSDLRDALELRIQQPNAAEWLMTQTGLSESGARQMTDYYTAVHKALGVLPSQRKLVLERFFDESGGMQLVLHSAFGSRINRAWGLALRKRFCRSFNFELQAAATDDAIVLSLGTQHSFPLEEVFRYLNSKTVRDLLIQALLDAPMFAIRWRWNATRSLALPRQRGGRKVPAPLQRMESENLLAAVFPDQLACLENIAGDREVPDHPLVQQTIEDCLTEAMDIDGLIQVIRHIENGTIECIARDLPEPSPLAHEILNAKPYAFLDNAPLEERRTQAVYTRRASDASANAGLGVLDGAAIDRVVAEAWPQPVNADELHEALLLVGAMTPEELERSTEHCKGALESLVEQRRAGQLKAGPHFWIAAERLPLLQAVYPGCAAEPALVPPESEARRHWEPADALRELVRGRMEVIGPTTRRCLGDLYQLPETQIEAALLALEGEGFILRGQFRDRSAGFQDRSAGFSPPLPTPSIQPLQTEAHAQTEEAIRPWRGEPRAPIEEAILPTRGEPRAPIAEPRAPSELEWCERRLLARIHRLTINRLRAEIQPVSVADFLRFLAGWQRLGAEHRAAGPDGVRAVLELLDGYELPAGAWEPEVLLSRVKEYNPQWLDQLCSTGRIGWGRLTPPQTGQGRPSVPVRSSPVALFTRENLAHWLALSPVSATPAFAPDTTQVLQVLQTSGALFFGELVKRSRLLPSRVEQALAELVAQGFVTSDSFEGLRALLIPQEKRFPFADKERKRHHRAITSVEFAGRWSLLGDRSAGFSLPSQNEALAPTQAEACAPITESVEAFAWVLLRRYGVVFRRLLERESLQVSWFELGRVYRRLEARGEIRGGFFVGGVSGEQFALPEAIGRLRSIRKTPAPGELLVISGADCLNLAGILTPGPRVTAIAANRLLLRDGVPVASLSAGTVTSLAPAAGEPDQAQERLLRIGGMPPSLRPYYSHHA